MANNLWMLLDAPKNTSSRRFTGDFCDQKVNQLNQVYPALCSAPSGCLSCSPWILKPAQPSIRGSAPSYNLTPTHGMYRFSFQVCSICPLSKTRTTLMYTESPVSTGIRYCMNPFILTHLATLRKRSCVVK